MAGAITTSRANALDANAGMGAEHAGHRRCHCGRRKPVGRPGQHSRIVSWPSADAGDNDGAGVFINVAAEAQLIAVGLVLILAAIIDRSGSSSLVRDLASLLFKTRNVRLVERIFNVIMAVALVAVIVVHFDGRKAVSANPQENGRSASSAASNQRYVDDLFRHTLALLIGSTQVRPG